MRYFLTCIFNDGAHLTKGFAYIVEDTVREPNDEGGLYTWVKVRNDAGYFNYYVVDMFDISTKELLTP